MRRLKVSTLILIFICCSKAFAYKEPTHRVLSESAVNFSNLSEDSSLLIGLGLQPFSDKQEFTNPREPNGAKLTIEQLVSDGADFEDDDPRYLNHFYNPVNNTPLTVGFVEVGLMSPDWALEDNGDVTSTLSGPQEYSYKEASNYFYLALTSQTEEVREQNWGKLFQTLGYVIHHVQDMAQPDHVRNDQHNDVTDSSWYEEYTDGLRAEGDLTIDGSVFNSLITGNTYPIPTEFLSAREFWTTQVTDSAIENRRGLADFTNRNFVSKDTIFLYNNNGLVPSPQYPLPTPNVTPIPVDIADPSIKGAQGQALCDQIKALSLITFPNTGCFIDFISTTVTGAAAGENVTNDRAASYSIFDKKLQDHNVDSIFTHEDGSFDTIDRSFTLNEFNFKAAHQYLIPRAVAYSAGLINHFFRGKIDIISNPSGTGWVIKNQSNEEMQGTFTLYYDYFDTAAGIEKRAVIPGAVWNETVAANSEVVVADYSVPAGLIRKTLVFNGRIGIETNAFAGKFSGGWSKPVNIPLIGNAFDVEIGSNGNAIVVYFLREYVNNILVDNIWSKYYTPSTGWGDTVLITSDSNNRPFFDSLVMDDNGNVLFVYTTSVGAIETIWSRSYTAASGWSNAVNVVSDNVHYIRLAMDSNGNAILAYRTSNLDANIWRLYTRRYTPPNGWGNAVLQVEHTGPLLNPFLSMDTNGDAMFVYGTYDNVNAAFKLYGRRYTPQFGWGGVSLIDGNSGVTRGALGIDALGNALIQFYVGNSVSTASSSLYYKYSLATGWGVAEPSSDIFYTLDMDSSGKAIALVRNSSNVATVKHYEPITGWGGLIQLSEPDQLIQSSGYILDVEFNGKAIVIWRDDQNVVWSDFYTP